MIVCLDTSGSMRGAPENVAKACVLQALRSAHAGPAPLPPAGLWRRRRGAGARTGHGRQGLDHLLACMGQSFDGGTDVQTPLERAMARVQQPAGQTPTC
jgi:uncharacterized protein with von Willebrand factor type A (vWA) domain